MPSQPHDSSVQGQAPSTLSAAETQATRPEDAPPVDSATSSRKREREESASVPLQTQISDHQADHYAHASAPHPLYHPNMMAYPPSQPFHLYPTVPPSPLPSDGTLMASAAPSRPAFHPISTTAGRPPNAMVGASSDLRYSPYMFQPPSALFTSLDPSASYNPYYPPPAFPTPVQPSLENVSPTAYILRDVVIIDAERRLQSLLHLGPTRSLYAVGVLDVNGVEELVETIRISSWSIYYDRDYAAPPLLKILCGENLYEIKSAAKDYEPLHQLLMRSANASSNVFRMLRTLAPTSTRVSANMLDKFGVSLATLRSEWNFIIKEAVGLADAHIALHPALEALTELARPPTKQKGTGKEETVDGTRRPSSASSLASTAIPGKAIEEKKSKPRKKKSEAAPPPLPVVFTRPLPVLSTIGDTLIGHLIQLVEWLYLLHQVLDTSLLLDEVSEHPLLKTMRQMNEEEAPLDDKWSIPHLLVALTSSDMPEKKVGTIFERFLYAIFDLLASDASFVTQSSSFLFGTKSVPVPLNLLSLDQHCRRYLTRNALDVSLLRGGAAALADIKAHRNLNALSVATKATVLSFLLQQCLATDALRETWEQWDNALTEMKSQMASERRDEKVLRASLVESRRQLRRLKKQTNALQDTLDALSEEHDAIQEGKKSIAADEKEEASFIHDLTRQQSAQVRQEHRQAEDALRDQIKAIETEAIPHRQRLKQYQHIALTVPSAASGGDDRTRHLSAAYWHDVHRCRNMPLGRDRFHREVWVLLGLPGLWLFYSDMLMTPLVDDPPLNALANEADRMGGGSWCWLNKWSDYCAYMEALSTVDEEERKLKTALMERENWLMTKFSSASRDTPSAPKMVEGEDEEDQQEEDAEAKEVEKLLQAHYDVTQQGIDRHAEASNDATPASEDLLFDLVAPLKEFLLELQHQLFTTRRPLKGIWTRLSLKAWTSQVKEAVTATDFVIVALHLAASIPLSEWRCGLSVSKKWRHNVLEIIDAVYPDEASIPFDEEEEGVEEEVVSDGEKRDEGPQSEHGDTDSDIDDDPDITSPLDDKMEPERRPSRGTSAGPSPSAKTVDTIPHFFIKEKDVCPLFTLLRETSFPIVQLENKPASAMPYHALATAFVELAARTNEVRHVFNVLEKHYRLTQL